RYTTIPFVLYSKGTSKPFIGSGVFKNPGHKQSKSFFGCVETPVFRAKKFIRHSNCCVQLELLAPASGDCDLTGHCTNHANSARSEEHTSELQSRFDLVCRLLLEKKNQRSIHD